jgi:hypothetical protein
MQNKVRKEECQREDEEGQTYQGFLFSLEILQFPQPRLDPSLQNRIATANTKALFSLSSILFNIVLTSRSAPALSMNPKRLRPSSAALADFFTRSDRSCFKSTTLDENFSMRSSNESNSALASSCDTHLQLHLDLSLFFMVRQEPLCYNYSFLCSKNLGL